MALLRCRPRCVLLVLFAFLTLITAHPQLRHIARVQYHYYVAESPSRCVLLGFLLLFAMFLAVGGAHPRLRHITHVH
ncbi:hypothetical protein B0H17DRAFT_1070798 [Mycena rosella]|uniref:Uncharacterized protein n=1 Tax=Mycena rosella TaxID=1033263 RepID=A0AAD7DC74_MYCRO|nr:hypothetical protein B0H17DRAFT_1070798 [Mycena rosella]